MDRKESLHRRLRHCARDHSVELSVVQRDYLLSWILAGIAAVPELSSNIVFKGGTALKKTYFGDYRFSEDLDFTALPGLPRGEDLEQKMHQVVEIAERLIGGDESIPIICERYIEKKKHPREQEAFKVRAQFPEQKRPLVLAMVEISCSESILTPFPRRPIIHSYGENMEASLFTYSLEEVVMEKLRAILYNTQKSHERNWTRSRARDYYDLWRIFGTYKKNLDLAQIETHLKEKCLIGDNVTFSSIDDFFAPRMIEAAAKDWESHLQYLVSDLPDFDTVKRAVYEEVKEIIVRIHAIKKGASS